ncbi:MAG: hypothetical protein AB7K41_01940 [Bdellovibrionales bacterium]
MAKADPGLFDLASSQYAQVMMGRSFLISLALAWTSLAEAQSEHELVRRVTVFPIKVSKELTSSADEAWWQIREILTENQRFLVASRNFLVQRDVYQPRSELKPADAVILGKLLDANALVSTFLSDRTLSMRVYEGEYGRLLWSHDFKLHPSLPISDQLVGAAKKLIYDFIASVPYQGFVMVDPLNQSALYSQGDKSLIKVYLGINSHIAIGDTLQIMRLYHDSVKPLFVPETVPEIYAEAKVISVEADSVVAELTRHAKSAPINEFSLVRVPSELKRLKEAYALNDQLKAQIGTEYYSPEITPVQQDIAERKPLATALTFILNLATFLLIAF